MKIYCNQSSNKWVGPGKLLSQITGKPLASKEETHNADTIKPKTGTPQPLKLFSHFLK